MSLTVTINVSSYIVSFSLFNKIIPLLKKMVTVYIFNFVLFILLKWPRLTIDVFYKIIMVIIDLLLIEYLQFFNCDFLVGSNRAVR